MIKILSRLSVGAKLALGFTVALLLMAGSGLLSLTDLSDMNASLRGLAEANLPAVANAAQLAQAITDYRLAEHRLLAGPESARDDAEQSLRARSQAVQARVARARKLATSPQEGDLVAAADREWARYLDASHQMVAVANNGAASAAEAFFDDIGSHRFEALVSTADSIVALNHDAAAVAVRHAEELYRRSRAVLFVAVVGALLASGLVAYSITRELSRRLKTAVRAAARIADDELTLPMAPDDEHDEIAQLTVALGQVSARRARNVSISKMTHELRTPLNAILGFAEVMLFESEVELAGPHRHHAEMILRSGQHLIRLIDDLLDLSRMEAGFLSLCLEDLDALEVARDARRLLEPLIEKQALLVTLAARSGTRCCVHADGTRLMQVLVNLMSNAVKYNRPGGRIDVVLEREGTEVRISVHDEGLGMSPQQQALLFKPFERLGREGSTIQGNGLGLVITNKLVRLMGGRMSVHSAPGVGSEFVVTLPAAKADPALARLGAVPAAPKIVMPAEAPRTSAVAPSRLEGRVLYIDDDETNRVLMQAYFLMRPAVELVLAEGGRRGMEIAKASMPEVMLIDMRMPEMDGPAVLRAVRSAPELQATRCIAVSANATPADISDALAAGFDGYLTKPLSTSDLFGCIDRWLRPADSHDVAFS
jgi:signal transduction histidine kinase/ActR/RegA family two-component response regulator